MLGSGYVLRYQIIDNNGKLFAYDSFPNDSSYVDLTQYQNNQIGYIQLYTGPVGAGSQVDTTSLYFDNSYDVAYTRGYEDGKNDGLSSGNAIIEEYKQAITTYKDTIQTLSKRISLLENSNRNYTNLIWTIGATPWESFKHIWNVEFGGINIANIITGLVTALLVIYLIKKIWK